MAATKTQDKSTDIARRSAPSLEALREMNDFESAARLLRAELGAEIVSSVELGDGFTLENDKDSLCGLPMLFVTWTFSDGEYGEFVVARALVQDKSGGMRKVAIVDGSTGICQQLRDIQEQHNGQAVAVTAKRGLRKSTYNVPIPNPKTGEVEMKPSTTFYIDTAA